MFGVLHLFWTFTHNQNLINIVSAASNTRRGSWKVLLPFHQRGYHSVCAHAEAAATSDQSADRVLAGTWNAMNNRLRTRTRTFTWGKKSKIKNMKCKYHLWNQIWLTVQTTVTSVKPSWGLYLDPFGKGMQEMQKWTFSVTQQRQTPSPWGGVI